eukprot:15017581-Heterocapsa_arctica.AAC.1
MAAPARGRPLPASPLVARSGGRQQARANLAGANIATLCINNELAQQAFKAFRHVVLKALMERSSNFG